MGLEMKLYKIRDWAKHFENNRTKELVRMSWVPMPNKMDGDGYTQLLDHENGAAHFGAWCAIVEIGSKCDPRGTLIRPDPSNIGGFSPHNARSLSRISRIPETVFSVVLPLLVTIGWIEFTEIPHEPAAAPQEGAPAPQVAYAGARAAGNGMERNGMTSSSCGSGEDDENSTSRKIFRSMGMDDDGWKTIEDKILSPIDAILLTEWATRLKKKNPPGAIINHIRNGWKPCSNVPIDSLCEWSNKRNLIASVCGVAVTGKLGNRSGDTLVVNIGADQQLIPAKKLTPESIVLKSEVEP